MVGSGASAQEPATAVLLIAAWAGLLTGLGEGCLRTAAKYVLHRTVWLDPHVVWMAPVADLLVFSVAGLLLYAAGARWPGVRRLSVVAGAAAGLGVLALLLNYPRLHPGAAVLLAAGLAVLPARLVDRHAHAFRRLVRRTVGSMGALVAVLGVGVKGWQVVAERRALERLPAPGPGLPNVLLIVLDTVRALSLSVYGYGRSTTPELGRFANRGVLFERAVATAPWTLPSHASMFTGHYPHELSADWLKPLDSTYPTLAERLRDRGYVTGGFVANFLYCGYEFGLDRGFVHYEDYTPSLTALVGSIGFGRVALTTYNRLWRKYQIAGRKSAARLNDAFLRWTVRPSGRPFFAFLNYYDAHSPYWPEAPFDRKFLSVEPRSRDIESGRRYTLEERTALRGAYEGAVAYVDHYVGLLLDTLERRGSLENTLVIITADHGEEFGEHGHMGHGNSLYLPSLQVPLLIIFPARVPPGRRVQRPVTLRDVPATVLSLLDLPSNAPTFPGRTLTRYWRDTADSSGGTPSLLLSEVNFLPGQPAWYPIAKGDMHSLIMGRYHYIRNGDGPPATRESCSSQ